MRAPSIEVDRLGTNYGGKLLSAHSEDHYYRIGVIDFLTRHTTMKTMETNIKSALYNVRRSSISAQKPEDYQTRFITFFNDTL